MKTYKRLACIVTAALYGILSLLWCGILAQALVYSSKVIETGGTEISIKSPESVMRLLLSLPAFVILFALASAVLVVVSVFMKRNHRKFTILICVFSALTSVLFLLLPPQAYLIPFYMIVRKLPVLRYSRIAYILISVAVILANILHTSKIESEVIKQ